MSGGMDDGYGWGECEAVGDGGLGLGVDFGDELDLEEGMGFEGVEAAQVAAERDIKEKAARECGAPGRGRKYPLCPEEAAIRPEADGGGRGGRVVVGVVDVTEDGLAYSEQEWPDGGMEEGDGQDPDAGGGDEIGGDGSGEALPEFDPEVAREAGPVRKAKRVPRRVKRVSARRERVAERVRLDAARGNVARLEVEMARSRDADELRAMRGALARARQWVRELEAA